MTKAQLIRSTHRGTIDLGSGPIACHVLEDGSHVLVQSMIQGVLGGAQNRHLARNLARIGTDSGALALRPVRFSQPGHAPGLGYDSEDVVKVLAAYQRAFLRGTLHSKQEPIARRAMAAIEAFMGVGLRAMIAEATGYQYVRPEDELARTHARLFRETMRAWEEQFDADWDKTLCRLYGHPYGGQPPMFAKNINAMVYRFAFGEAEYKKLKEKNPNPKHGSNHHQLLTDEGKIKLSQAINTVRGIAKLSRNPRDFLAKLGVVYSDVPLQLDWC